MRFSLDGRRYTVAYLSHPANPPGGEMSDRRYGRFGEFIPYHLTEAEPLTLRYRFWISADREVSREDVERHFAHFANASPETEAASSAPLPAHRGTSFPAPPTTR